MEPKMPSAVEAKRVLVIHHPARQAHEAGMNMKEATHGLLASQIGRLLPIQVLRSHAGFYLGTFDPESGPFSRESVEYWPTQGEAEEALRTGNWSQKGSL